MTTFAVKRRSDGVEVYRYNADQAIEWAGFEFASHEHLALPDAPVSPGVAPAPTPARITKLAFRNRFTQAEKIAIEMAALDNPSAPMAQRQLAAALRAQLADQRDATHIDLSRQDTRGGVQALEQAGLIGVGRAAVILDEPPTEAEVWNG